jgi:hypothetical protein
MLVRPRALLLAALVVFSVPFGAAIPPGGTAAAQAGAALDVASPPAALDPTVRVPTTVAVFFGFPMTQAEVDEVLAGLPRTRDITVELPATHTGLVYDITYKPVVAPQLSEGLAAHLKTTNARASTLEAHPATQQALAAAGKPAGGALPVATYDAHAAEHWLTAEATKLMPGSADFGLAILQLQPSWMGVAAHFYGREAHDPDTRKAAGTHDMNAWGGEGNFWFYDVGTGVPTHGEGFGGGGDELLNLLKLPANTDRAPLLVRDINNVVGLLFLPAFWGAPTYTTRYHLDVRILDGTPEGNYVAGLDTKLVDDSLTRAIPFTQWTITVAYDRAKDNQTLAELLSRAMKEVNGKYQIDADVLSKEYPILSGLSKGVLHIPSLIVVTPGESTVGEASLGIAFGSTVQGGIWGLVNRAYERGPGNNADTLLLLHEAAHSLGFDHPHEGYVNGKKAKSWATDLSASLLTYATLNNPRLSYFEETALHRGLTASMLKQAAEDETLVWDMLALKGYANVPAKVAEFDREMRENFTLAQSLAKEKKFWSAPLGATPSAASAALNAYKIARHAMVPLVDKIPFKGDPLPGSAEAVARTSVVEVANGQVRHAPVWTWSPLEANALRASLDANGDGTVAPEEAQAQVQVLHAIATTFAPALEGQTLTWDRVGEPQVRGLEGAVGSGQPIRARVEVFASLPQGEGPQKLSLSFKRDDKGYQLVRLPDGSNVVGAKALTKASDVLLGGSQHPGKTTYVQFAQGQAAGGMSAMTSRYAIVGSSGGGASFQGATSAAMAEDTASFTFTSPTEATVTLQTVYPDLDAEDVRLEADADEDGEVSAEEADLFLEVEGAYLEAELAEGLQVPTLDGQRPLAVRLTAIRQEGLPGKVESETTVVFTATFQVQWPPASGGERTLRLPAEDWPVQLTVVAPPGGAILAVEATESPRMEANKASVRATTVPDRESMVRFSATGHGVAGGPEAKGAPGPGPLVALAVAAAMALAVRRPGRGK